MMLAHTYYWACQPEKALQEAEILVARNDIEGYVLFNLGGLYCDLGDPEKSLAIVRRAITGGFRNIEAFKKHNFSDPKHINELQKISVMLEELIESEKQS